MTKIPDESIDLVLTDPIYEDMQAYRELAIACKRLLKPNKAALVSCGIRYIDQVLDVMKPYLQYRWAFIWYQSNIIKRTGPGYGLWSMLLWMEKGNSKPTRPLQDLRNVPLVRQPGKSTWHQDHPWKKGQTFYDYYAIGFTKPGDLILDPFMGGAQQGFQQLKPNVHL